MRLSVRVLIIGSLYWDADRQSWRNARLHMEEATLSGYQFDMAAGLKVAAILSRCFFTAVRGRAGEGRQVPERSFDAE